MPNKIALIAIAIITNKIVLIVIAIIIVCVMLFCNKKVKVFPVLLKQLQVFRNAKTDKMSLWDIVCFILLPVILALLVVFGFECIVDTALAGVLTTVFAFVFTVLFGFSAILVGKLDSNNEIEKQVVGETFVSIMTSNILSLISAVLSIVVFVANNQKLILALSLFIYSFSFMVMMLLLMISKRTFSIYCNNKR